MTRPVPEPSRGERETTVAAVVIGDEILSGKTADTNSATLIAACRAAGARLRRVVVVPDRVEAIADEVRRCASASDVVITSGGVGPTHDDRTVEGVAAAFALPVVRDPTLERLIRDLWADRINDAALRLADVPYGARLIHADDRLLPLVAVANVFLLPGVPSLFVRKLESVRPELTGRPRASANLWVPAYETDIAADLEAAERRHPTVTVGSYPRPRGSAYRVWVTVEGPDPDAVEAATRSLLAALPAGTVATSEPAPPAPDPDREE